MAASSQTSSNLRPPYFTQQFFIVRANHVTVSAHRSGIRTPLKRLQLIDRFIVHVIDC